MVQDVADRAGGATRAFTADSERLAAANIHPVTGLATDYLNHFNEVTMLLEIVASMPDVMDDILAWRPMSYPEHFSHTGFRHKALAIATWYELTEDERRRFDLAVAAVNEAILDARMVLTDSDPTLLDVIAPALAVGIRAPMTTLLGIINGVEIDGDLFAADTTQGAVDHLLR